jgi:1-acyl-sn-glycerol-3-phosphate acyltransferase
MFRNVMIRGAAKVRPGNGTPHALPRIMGLRDDGLGYDAFGLHRPAVRRALRWGRGAFERYFRVESRGAEHIPRTGPAILVANHGGVLPVDGAILWLDVVRRTGRVPRPVAARFVARVPLIRTAFARVGAVPGTRDAVDRLLEHGELVEIFPEGISGVAKPYRHRYQLQAWNTGHARLALRHRAPVIPVAIIGAEESWPLAARVPLHPFGAPYLPIAASPVPLPVRYHIAYGAPLALHDEVTGDPEVPATIEAAAARVRRAVEALVADGLSRRAMARPLHSVRA